jgi:DinB family protein
MELSQWFDYQLRSTLDGFIWAVQQVPKDRLYTLPPKSLGEWSAAQHVFHILEYEEKFALPTMSQWLGVPPVIPEAGEGRIEQGPPQIEEKLVQFEQVREAEIGMLPKFDLDAWSAVKRTTFWGDVTLYWLVCKTYQHTLEHTHNVLGLTLFWDTTIRHPAH